MVTRLQLDSHCPGALHAVEARDGLLVRVRVPGGSIQPEQLAMLARASASFGDGNIDITARANVQLRGVRQAALSALALALGEANFIPSAEHDRVRNIEVSPFSGFHSSERVDALKLARELDSRIIADPELSRLPAKFRFALDGGAPGANVHGADLALTADEVSGDMHIHVWVASQSLGLHVMEEQAVDVLIDAARYSLELARKNGYNEGGWRLATLPNAAHELRNHLQGRLQTCTCPSSPSVRTVSPLGVFASNHVALVNLVPTVPLGRLTVVQALGIAEIATAHALHLRLGWWRGIVLAGAQRSEVTSITEQLESLGMPVDNSLGYVGISTCSGIHGCLKAHADVRQDASALAAQLVQLQLPPGWNAIIAGCSKRCAMRERASVVLTAAPLGYNILLDGVERGQAVPSSAAIDVVLASLR